MKRATLTIVLLAGLARAAHGQGINLAWDDCTLGGFTHDKTPICSPDIGAPYKLVISVGLDEAITEVNGAQGIVEFRFDAPVVPDYWRLDTGGCRQGKLLADPLVGSSNAPFSCPEPWSQVGGTVGAVNATLHPSIPNRLRVTWIVAVPGVTTLDPAIAPDWYLMALNVIRGGSACAGCETGACITAQEIRLTRPAQTPGGDVFINGPAHTQFATWRAGGTLSCPGCPTDAYCPVERVTWGTVKSLFR